MENQVSVGFVILFYGVITALAFFLGGSLADLDVLVWHNRFDTTAVTDALLGAGVGIVTVIVSQILDRTTRWARSLTREFAKILGNLTITQAFVFAVASGIAEELFFRGFLQQLLTEVVFGGGNAEILGLVTASVIFGILHIGPDIRRFWPWTAMAIVLGGVFGLMYLYTGNVLAPIVAHFTINFFNLLFIGQHEDTELQHE